MARLVLQPRADLTNNHQAVHGGVLVSLMDSAMSSAALSASGFTKAVVTIDMTSSFLKPAHGRLVATPACRVVANRCVFANAALKTRPVTPWPAPWAPSGTCGPEILDFYNDNRRQA